MRSFLFAFSISAGRLVCLSLLALALPQRSTAAEVKLPVTASADVRNLDEADQNFLTFTGRGGGKSSWQLLVRSGGTSAKPSFKTYLQADLRGQAGPGRPLGGGKVVLTAMASGDPRSARPVSLYLYGITDHHDQWAEAEITWNNAPKNDVKSPGGIQPEGTVRLAEVQLPGDVKEGPVEFKSEALTKYLNWKAGALTDAYGTGASQNAVATFIVVASDRSPTFRFFSRLYESKDPEQTARSRPLVVLQPAAP